MKIIYFILGVIVGITAMYIYACFKMERPSCFEWQYMEKDFTGEYICKDKV